MKPAPFPLSWPGGIPRTKNKAQSSFKATLPAALKNVNDALRRFSSDTGKRITDVILSSNAGGLQLGQPEDTGVAAWFTWDDQQRCIAVDRYPKIEDNLQAIFHIIEARRTEMRHGGLHIVQQTFKGFTALEAPKSWRQILGLGPGSVTKAGIESAFRKLAAIHHPDKPGGSHAKMAELNRAREEGIAEIEQ